MRLATQAVPCSREGCRALKRKECDEAVTTGISRMAAGVRNPTRPQRWLVPPWEVDASIFEVIEHFMRFEPWHVTEVNTANQLAYYRGFANALHTASTGRLLGSADWKWYETVRALIVRCADASQQEQLNGIRDTRQKDHEVARRALVS
jgi:hypothetical protein